MTRLSYGCSRTQPSGVAIQRCALRCQSPSRGTSGFGFATPGVVCPADGWMGASLTYDAPRAIEPGKPLVLRYGLYVHGGSPAPEQLNRRWEEFSRLPGETQ